MSSNVNPIPKWNSRGVLPADIEESPKPPYEVTTVSPYQVSLSDMIARFSVTQVRRRLLKGLLSFRAELHDAGLEQGFQWIDGSFVENVEETRNRPPGDIDVVTFFHIPENETQYSLVERFPNIFSPEYIFENYGIDSHYLPLDKEHLDTIVSLSAYWNSLWSHTEDNRWKGYLQVDLGSSGDAQAREELERLDGVDG